ncbi:MAG: TAXI family TRAP transporter solute-binding subunit [Thermoanaerobaculia bacterium]
MLDEKPDRGVGSSLSLPAVLATVVALVIVIGGFVTYRSLSEADAHRQIVIATGPENGIYHALGVAAGGMFEAEGVVGTATVQPTEGSIANARLIGGLDGGADLAFIQSDTPVNDQVRLITSLYDEVLHILVAKEVAEEIQSVFDLRGRRVALGAEGSGTRPLAERVLEHFQVEVGEDLAVSPEEAAAGLVDGSIDAAFALSAIPSPLVGDLAKQDAVRFLSLGDAQELGNESEALALVHPTLRGTTIPRSTYVRLPEEPVSTIAVSALLVASRDLDADLVRDCTAALFRNRSKAIELEDEGLVVAGRIREDYRPDAHFVPYHEGAVAYYERADPPFYVEYAETMSLALTLLVGTYSGYIALREWMRRRMKNRIDSYYMQVNRLTGDLGALSLEELAENRDALEKLRSRAFSDLVGERLRADESFTIFQDYVGGQLASIDARIAEKTA